MREYNAGMASERAGLGLAGCRAGEGLQGGSPVILRVDAREGDAAHWIMAAEEKPVRKQGG